MLDSRAVQGIPSLSSTAGWRRPLCRPSSVTAYARRRSPLTAAVPDLAADRSGTGLTAVVSVNLDRSEFHGSTRGRLGGDTVRACVAEAVQEHLGTWLEKHPERAAMIVTGIVRNATRH
ncbi:DNA gyrase/topoisomerase IV subunit B [Streptomyces sp. V3I8]|uniref:hypothetical protein n=1 Tax=Streptomyces sp. V3I8 TaxID=3042279 RepID=UPI00277E09DC|nr:hypothetical protein [Streptomyces sp. V3I8]MDQ1033912.1 DNA gyrase/topoisomerase IV subunit B [Streptomyces sp. V3I8]